MYPDLRRRYGPVVTYANAPLRHSGLEFSFDVVQVAAGRYRTQDYHHYIGLRISEPVLARAFRATYGLELGQVLFNVEASVMAFPFTVNQLIPVAARAAWHHQRREIPPAAAASSRNTAPIMSARAGAPGCWLSPGSCCPKLGPLQTYAFQLPGQAGEQRFRASSRRALGQYAAALVRQQPADTAPAPPSLSNRNLDTGHATVAGAYPLAGAAHGRLLRTAN